MFKEICPKPISLHPGLATSLLTSKLFGVSRSTDAGQQWARALQLLSEMQLARLAVSVVTCTAVITVLGRGQQPVPCQSLAA